MWRMNDAPEAKPHDFARCSITCFSSFETLIRNEWFLAMKFLMFTAFIKFVRRSCCQLPFVCTLCGQAIYPLQTKRIA